MTQKHRAAIDAMNAAADEFITIDGQQYRKFIPYPGPVDDGTLRCISCGQIDEPEYHDDELCCAARSNSTGGSEDE